VSNSYNSPDKLRQKREEMVRYHLERRGISDPRVLEAFRSIPREKFVPEARRNRAYDDCALPIGEGQTISQPYIVALMTQQLKVEAGLKVLEIGTGSGYQTAILAKIGAEIFTVEMSKSLTNLARQRLENLGLADQVKFKVGDGTRGWEEEAPFDRIIVTAAAPKIPLPLEEQLADGGRMVIPVGSRRSQTMTVVIKKGPGNFERHKNISCVFVPLVGVFGWDG